MPTPSGSDWPSSSVGSARSPYRSTKVLNTVREPAAESVAMGEIAAEQNYRSRSAWEAPVADTHSFAVATLRASSDYVRGFAELFNADHLPLYAHLPLARAALEARGPASGSASSGSARLTE
jgi:hypothetical protein